MRLLTRTRGCSTRISMSAIRPLRFGCRSTPASSVAGYRGHPHFGRLDYRDRAGQPGRPNPGQYEACRTLGGPRRGPSSVLVIGQPSAGPRGAGICCLPTPSPSLELRWRHAVANFRQSSSVAPQAVRKASMQSNVGSLLLPSMVQIVEAAGQRRTSRRRRPRLRVTSKIRPRRNAGWRLLRPRRPANADFHSANRPPVRGQARW
jgi:hypothetical protein